MRSLTPYRAAPAASSLGLALGLVLVLTGCSGQDDDGDARPEPSATEHNDADVAFAQAMIPHHAQALGMVDLTRGRPLDQEVIALTEEIQAAQSPEIETMSDWLVDWDEEVPETLRDHANAGHDMEGMMSHEDLAELDAAGDEEFQDLWLEMMIEHHEGAVEMAQTQLDEGRHQPALDLAEEIIDSQEQEIDRMQELISQ